MLGVGIDWSEEFHLVALGRPGDGVIDIGRVEHSPKAVDALVAKMAALEPDLAEVRVVIENRHGMLVERLIDAGYVVVPVNPDLIARRGGPPRKKDDTEDARIACLIALDRFEKLRPLIPHGEIAGELRAVARDDERAARDERRLLNRLRQDLITTFPAALAVAGADLGSPTFLRMLERWPSATALAGARRDELVALARSCRHGWPHRFADKVAAALAHDHFVPRDYLVRAKADTIRLAATQLLAIGAQGRAWERRMGELLLGASRGGKDKQPREDQRGQGFPGGEIYLSFPGLGDRLAARIAARSAIIPSSSRRRTRCNATGERRRSRAARARASSLSRAGLPTTTRSAMPSSNGRFAASGARGGRGSSTTGNEPTERATTRRCARSATAGSRSCGTVFARACSLTSRFTSPTEIGRS